MPLKYAILVAGVTSVDGKGNFADMFLRLLRDEGAQEEWQVFTAWEGQLPTAEQLAEFDGFVITGSVADAFGEDDWLVSLRKTVRAAMQAKKQVLGVCFGHQLVGSALGAKVGRAGCWEVGAREVEVAPDSRRQLAEAGAGWAKLLPERLCLLEFHQDQVLEAPEGAAVLASSERCPVEMFAVGPHVLCIQGHPEFDTEVVQSLAEPRLEKFGEADVERMRAQPCGAACGQGRAASAAAVQGFPEGGRWCAEHLTPLTHQADAA
ncbi:hypothetical protein ABPG77_009193 [Micractinium sp. CCAP 211/92]